MKEAPPIVTGKDDDRTAFFVFRGWKSNPDMQARWNPWIEMRKAKELRNQVMLRFSLRSASQMVGDELTERCWVARDVLARGLRERGWTDRMIRTYFGQEEKRNAR
jgi:hypothetical protein